MMKYGFGIIVGRFIGYVKAEKVIFVSALMAKAYRI